MKNVYTNFHNNSLIIFSVLPNLFNNLTFSKNATPLKKLFFKPNFVFLFLVHNTVVNKSFYGYFKILISFEKFYFVSNRTIFRKSCKLM